MIRKGDKPHPDPDDSGEEEGSGEGDQEDAESDDPALCAKSILPMPSCRKQGAPYRSKASGSGTQYRALPDILVGTIMEGITMT